MNVYAPTVSIIEAPAAGILLVGIDHDHEDGRGGMLRLSEVALEQLPDAIAKALMSRRGNSTEGVRST